MKKNFVIFVFARLKPSQIEYKIIPLCRSPFVERVYVLRKTPIEVNNNKIQCIALPKILRIRLFYWLFTALYGALLIKKKGANLIVSYNIFPHGFNGYVASKLTRTPFIFAEINEETLNYYQNNILKPFIRKILNKASYITIPGSKTELRWRKNGYNKLVRLHSTIDSDVYAPAAKTKKIDFLYIGEFDDNKRPNLILDAFIEIRNKGINASMCLIGFGKLEEALVEVVKRNDLGDFVLIVKTNDVLESLLNSKIFVMASLSEGIPCAMLEAMACELIVVVPPVGDIADVIKSGQNGLLHDNSKQDLKNKMIEAYNSYDNLQKMRAKARETVINGHCYDVATERWNKVLSNL